MSELLKITTTTTQTMSTDLPIEDLIRLMKAADPTSFLDDDLDLAEARTITRAVNAAADEDERLKAAKDRTEALCEETRKKIKEIAAEHGATPEPNPKSSCACAAEPSSIVERGLEKILAEHEDMLKGLWCMFSDMIRGLSPDDFKDLKKAIERARADVDF